VPPAACGAQESPPAHPRDPQQWCSQRCGLQDSTTTQEMDNISHGQQANRLNGTLAGHAGSRERAVCVLLCPPIPPARLLACPCGCTSSLCCQHAPYLARTHRGAHPSHHACFLQAPTMTASPERNKSPRSLPRVGAGALMRSPRLGFWLRDRAPPLLTTSSMVYLMMMVSFIK